MIRVLFAFPLGLITQEAVFLFPEKQAVDQLLGNTPATVFLAQSMRGSTECLIWVPKHHGCK